MKDNYLDAYTYRLEDARTLLKYNRLEGAIYVGGYAVECVMKYAHGVLFGSKTGNVHDIVEIYNSIVNHREMKSGSLNYLANARFLSANLVKGSIVANWRPGFRYQGKLHDFCTRHCRGKTYDSAIAELSKKFVEDAERICNTVRMSIIEYEGRSRR